VRQVAAQIPWWHNMILMDKIKDEAEREWYIQKTMIIILLILLG
jgi:hypothetical protein